MSTESTGTSGGSGLPDDQAEVRRQIEETREQLGGTVEALAHKADVKSQVKERVDETKSKVSALADEAKEDPVGFAQAKAQDATEQVKQDPKRYAAIAAAVGAALLLVRRRRRRRHS